MSEYKLNPADFLDEADMKVFQYYIDHPGAVLMEMANVRGDRVVRNRLPFSFYFSDKNAVHQAHGIRVKIFWNSSRAKGDADGYLELHGDYKYSQLTDNKPSSKELKTALEFFKTNKVLFAAAWEGVLDPNDILLYFEADLSFKDLLGRFHYEDFPKKERWLNFARITHCTSLEDLEKCVRKFNIFNMND